MLLRTSTGRWSFRLMIIILIASLAMGRAATAQEIGDDNITVAKPDYNLNTLSSLDIDPAAFRSEVDFKIECLRTTLLHLTRKKDVVEQIEYGMKLFNFNDTVNVDITSNKEPFRRTLRIRKYLTRMSQLSFSSVDIQYSNCIYGSNFVKGPDGNYHSTVVFEQIFKGYSGESKKPAYQSVDRKFIEIIVKVWDDEHDGKVQHNWAVFLGNIGVEDHRI